MKLSQEVKPAHPMRPQGGMDAAIAAITHAVSDALSTIHQSIASWPFALSWIAMAGLDTPQSVPLAHQRLTRAFKLDSRPHQLLVSNDCHLLAAAMDLPKDRTCRQGVAIIAGTGSIAMAFSEPTASTSPTPTYIELGRVGGWGHLLGDEGSAWWTGRELLRRVLFTPSTIVNQQDPLFLQSPSHLHPEYWTPY